MSTYDGMKQRRIRQRFPDQEAAIAAEKAAEDEFLKQMLEEEPDRIINRAAIREELCTMYHQYLVEVRMNALDPDPMEV